MRGQATLILDRRGRQLASFRGGRPLAWAPDGQKIAFVRGAPSTLWVATLRNHNLRRIALNPATSQTPLWSPDSRQLAYVAQISRQPLRDGTYVSAADGSRRHVVPTTPYTMPWAWTSNRDLFVSRWDSKNYDFAVIPIRADPPPCSPASPPTTSSLRSSTRSPNGRHLPRVPKPIMRRRSSGCAHRAIRRGASSSRFVQGEDQRFP